MKRKGKKLLTLAIVLASAFAAWTFLIQTADVKPLGQNGTNIGFATLNLYFFKLTGVNMTLYTITDWLGLVPVCVCFVFASAGLYQMIKRKSLFKVDIDIILLGIYYAAVIFAYLIFEEIPINYRPVLIDGRMESSYPSSTTLLVLCVMPTLIFEAKKRIKNANVKKTICVLSVLFSAFTVIGRLISGVHWLTDILGGAILSFALYSFYKASVFLLTKEN